MTHASELRYRLVHYTLGLLFGLLALMIGYSVYLITIVNPPGGAPPLVRQAAPGIVEVPEPTPRPGNSVVPRSSGRFTIASYTTPEEAVYGINQMFLNGFVRKECYVWRDQLTCLFYNP